MSGAGPTPVDPRPWEYLLSHHLPDRYDRTLRLPVGRRSVRLCTRCTAQLAGLGAFVLAAVLAIPAGPGLLSPSLQLLVALAPLPAAADWTTQAIGRRESSTPVRLVTGALLGFAFSDLLSLLVLRPWWWFVVGLGFAGLYMGAIVTVLAFTGTWRSVLEERFPGAVPAPPPPPPAVPGASSGAAQAPSGIE
ncbi:MAG: DUF2085 domain-containing protein [Thermoplasmata archaeon]|nr:DUF2085 domain-containing protein [Thermoplasmata archaeon]